MVVAKKASLTLSSAHSWVYGGDDNQNDNAAAHYAIDFIDLEQVAAAIPKPANFISITDKGAVIERIWVESVECGYWVGGKSESTGLIIKDSRFRNTGADAVNFCNGTATSVIDNCHARHTGDDAFAIYGGRGNRIENCLGADALTYPGLTVSSAFNSYPLESATVEGLTLNRCGGSYWTPPQQFGAIWLFSSDAGFSGVTIRNVSLFEPTFQGVHLQSENGHAMANVLLENMTITKPTTYGIQIKAGALGTATFRNIAVGVNSPTLTLVNQSPRFNPVQEGIKNTSSGIRKAPVGIPVTRSGSGVFVYNALGRSDGAGGAQAAIWRVGTAGLKAGRP